MRRGSDRVVLEARRHPVVLARPFAKAVVLGAAGAALVLVGWPATLAAVALLALAAAVAGRAAWRWERTRVVVTADRFAVEHGTLRRRAAGVTLDRAGAVEVEQTLLGRLLGYGTVVAGDLEVPFVSDPARVARLVERAGAAP